MNSLTRIIADLQQAERLLENASEEIKKISLERDYYKKQVDLLTSKEGEEPE